MDQRIFNCKHCKKPFLDESSLLRHVSHKASCKEHYGEELDWMKQEARLQSKRKYNHKPSTVQNEVKRYQHEKEKRKIAAKERYRKTKLPNPFGFKTKAFKALYSFLYNLVEDEVTQEKLVEIGFDTVFNTAYDQSVDPAMSQWEETLKENIGNCNDSEIENKYDINAEIERAHEETFKANLKKNIAKLNDAWIKTQQWNLHVSCERKAQRRTRNFYQDFCKDVYPTMVDDAMDFAFTKTVKELDEYSLDDFSFERDLNASFRSALLCREDVSYTVIDSDLCKKMKKVFKDLMLKDIRLSSKNNFPNVRKNFKDWELDSGWIPMKHY